MKGRWIVLLGLMILFQPLTAQNYVGKKKEIEAILKNVEKFSAMVMSANHVGVANAYTQDGKIFPDNRDIISGRDDISMYWKMPDDRRIIYHKVTPVEIKINGNEAYDYGYYEGTTQTADGKETSWKGKYVIIWRKEKGDWKIYLDIWNRIPN